MALRSQWERQLDILRVLYTKQHLRPEVYLITEEMLSLARLGDMEGAFALRRAAIDDLEAEFVNSLGLKWVSASEP